MQSGGYGGVSEFQQFIMDGAFAMSAPPPPPQQQPGSQPAAPAAAGQQEPFRYQPLHHHALPPHHHHHAPPMPPHFAHFAGGGIPFTQQLLHQAAAAAAGHHHPHLQLFQEPHHQKQPSAARWAPHGQHHHHHHLGFDVEAAVPESSGAPSPAPNVPPFLAAAMNFKLGVDAGGGSGATGGTDVNDGMLHDEAATESRLRRWPGDEEASIKEPTWYPSLAHKSRSPFHFHSYAEALIVGEK